MTHSKRIHSEETKRKIALGNTGKVFSLERRKNIGLSRLIIVSLEQMEKFHELRSKRYCSSVYIMKQVNISYKVYRRLIADHPLPQIKFSTTKFDAPQFEQIISLCENGMPYKQIAQHYKVSNKTMRNIIVKLSEFYSIKPILGKRPAKTDEHRAKIREFIVGYNKQNPKKGAKNPNWQGGITPLNEAIRCSSHYNQWRKSILKRDYYKCVLCSSKLALEVDHIYPFCLLVQEGRITSLEEAIAHSPLWELNNGRTLCKKCHLNSETHGRKARNYMKNQFIEEKITLKQLGERLGVQDFNNPEAYDAEDYDYEILSFDSKTGSKVWKPITGFFVKSPSKTHYRLGKLKGTAEHKVLYNGNFVKLKEHPQAIEVNEPIQVVDCEVDETHNYFSMNEVNHNSTTPGGMAIPYACSVRLKLSGIQQIKSGDMIRGITVDVAVIKNKVGYPHRKSTMNVIFGVGINDDEQCFDIIRQYCDTNKFVFYNGKRLKLDGTGAWKTFSVVDDSTGEVLEEVKFRKDEFNDKVIVPYNEYFEAMLEKVMVINESIGVLKEGQEEE